MKRTDFIDKINEFMPESNYGENGKHGLAYFMDNVAMFEYNSKKDFLTISWSVGGNTRFLNGAEDFSPPGREDFKIEDVKFVENYFLSRGGDAHSLEYGLWSFTAVDDLYLVKRIVEGMTLLDQSHGSLRNTDLLGSPISGYTYSRVALGIPNIEQGKHTSLYATHYNTPKLLRDFKILAF